MRTKSLLLVALLLAAHVSAATVRLGDEIQVPVPVDWEVLGDTTSYPFLLMAATRDAEMLIFKSTIERDGSIDNQEALKASVDRVVDSVILTLSESKLLTSSGYSGGDNVRFVLEFTSKDEAEGATVRHRMMGVLYRLPDGNQLLFTLWARAAFEDYFVYEESFIGMQRDFNFAGEHESDVFSTPPSRYVTVGIPITLVIVLVGLLRVRQRQQSPKPKRKPAPVWTCACGTENDTRESICQFCGQRRQMVRAM